MDLLQEQLNKNPKTRINNNYRNHSEYEQKSSHSYSSNSNFNNRNRKNSKKSRNKKHRTTDHSVYMSKRLSFYLRHGAEKAGLKIRNDGYVKVTDILRLNEFKQKNANFEVIKNIVDTNDKKRFSMMEEKNTWYIRANQ